MKKWEYLRVYFASSLFLSEMNALGELGWEVFHIEEEQGKSYAYLKREKQPPQQFHSPLEDYHLRKQ